MYGRICRYRQVTGMVDGLIPDGRRLAAAISRLPGFVAYALLDAGDGGLISVSLFDNPAGLADAERLIEQWADEQQPSPLSSPSEAATGEVIIQKGM